MTNAIAPVPVEAPASLSLVNSEAIGAAVALGKDGVEVLERLHAIAKEERAATARAAFFDALAEFQAECPDIAKNRTAVRDPSKEGIGANRLYAYADLAQIVRVVRPLLAKHGLSFSWSSALSDKTMVVTCTVRHRGGHSESSSFGADATAGTGIMSSSQKAGGAVTFAERYSLIQALGLTTTEDDTDARDFDQTEEPAALVSQEQEATLSQLLDAAPDPKGERARMLAYLKVASLSDIPAAKFPAMLKALKEKNAKGWRS